MAKFPLNKQYQETVPALINEAPLRRNQRWQKLISRTCNKLFSFRYYIIILQFDFCIKYLYVPFFNLEIKKIKIVSIT